MFRDNFFFNKMISIKLEPLEPGQMLEAYLKQLIRRRSGQKKTRSLTLHFFLFSTYQFA